MKVAPEHVSPGVLDIMGKPGPEVYETFLHVFEKLNERLPERRYLVNYFLSAHPGAGLGEALDLGLYCLNRRLHPEQVQDFIPLPMTVSAAMYHTGFHPLTGAPVHVPRSFRERKMQRALVQYKNRAGHPLVREALEKLDARHLERLFSEGSRRNTGKKSQQGSKNDRRRRHPSPHGSPR